MGCFLATAVLSTGYVDAGYGYGGGAVVVEEQVVGPFGIMGPNEQVIIQNNGIMGGGIGMGGSEIIVNNGMAIGGGMGMPMDLLVIEEGAFGGW